MIVILLQEFCLIFNIILCFGIPILGLYLLRKNLPHIFKTFFLGITAFSISQMILRLPILQYVLPHFMWFHILNTHLILNALFYGFTAGIFEECARLIFMKFFTKKDQTLYHGIIFGLGHGGIEAILFVGISSIIYALQLPSHPTILGDTSAYSLFLGGIERLFAITFHVGASIIVLYGIQQKKAFRFTLFAITLHGLLDTGSILLPVLLHLDTLALELCIMFYSMIVLLLGIRLFIPIKFQKQKTFK